MNVIVDDYIHLMEGKGSDPGLAKAYKAVQSSHENCEKAEVMDAQLIGKFKATVEALEERLEKYLAVREKEFYQRVFVFLKDLSLNDTGEPRRTQEEGSEEEGQGRGGGRGGRQ